MRWFRFYAEARTDPKVMALPPVLFRAWVDMLCLACESKANDGSLPPVEVIAVAQHWSLLRTETALEELVKRGLLDRDRKGIRPHNWEARQYKSDVSTERVRKHRRNGALPVSETFQKRPQRQRTDSETEILATAATARARASNIFALFEELTGRPVPDAILADELKEAEREHIPDCIAYVFREAAANEARTWAYCKAIFAGHQPGQCGAVRKRPAKDRQGDARKGTRSTGVAITGPDIEAGKRFLARTGAGRASLPAE